MRSFDDVTTWTPEGDGWTAQVPDDWMQGRSAFGGLVAAAAMRAMRGQADGRPARTVQATFLGPVGGAPAQLRTRTLRSGRSLSFLEARIEQDGTERTVVSATFGGDRPSESSVPLEAVELPDPEGFQTFPYVPGITPAFTQHMDLRWTEGSFPFTGAETSVLAGFARFRQPVERGPERLLGILDAFPAPTLQQLSRPAPASTVTWTAHLVRPDDVPVGDWCWYRSEAVTAGDGYVSFVAKLYGPDGRLLAWLDQLAVVFG